MSDAIFKIGQYVVYGGDGVCEVVGVGTPDLPNLSIDEKFYFLRPVNYDGMIYTPVNNCHNVRRIIDRQEAQALLDGFMELETCVISSRDKKQLAASYAQLLSDNTCEARAKTVKSIWLKRDSVPGGKKTLSIMEEQLLKKTEYNLFSELSVALGTSYECVRDALSRPVFTN